MKHHDSTDPLGDRMKREYENRTRFYLPRRTYTLIRVDGKSFHTYTRDCARPYDTDLMADMDTTAIALCENSAGAVFAFVQSDEISVLLTDFALPQTEAWFDGNLQKIASVTASIATAHFNAARSRRGISSRPAYFDSRVWTMAQPTAVFDYFLWRQQDAARNSISMTTAAYFSPTQQHGKSSREMREMLLQEKGVDWNELPVGFRRGRFIERISRIKDVEYTDKRTGEVKVQTWVTRHEWRSVEPPVFAEQSDWLQSRIPCRAEAGDFTE
jgi:tRNA(His) guanylyltransferase